MSIIGYTYQGENYAPDAIIEAVTSSEKFDGWALGKGITMPVEQNLDEIAYHFGIDRHQEESFDSDDFPKTIDTDLHDVEVGISFLNADGDYVDAHGNVVS